MGEIDFSKYGYKGDDFEEYFKPFTVEYMEWWWQFREVLQASDRSSGLWKTLSDNQSLSDEDQKQLIGISLLNYAVYTGIAEALTFYQEMGRNLFANPSYMQIFTVRRLWKSAYSSLYSSFTALASIVYVLATEKPVVTIKNGEMWNLSPGIIINKHLTEPHNLQVKGLLKQGQDHKSLKIRAHLDHFWTIWMKIEHGDFRIDKAFEKGRIVVHPETEAPPETNALVMTYEHIVEMTTIFNDIYRELTLKKVGYLDTYLEHKKWYVDYGPSGSYDENRRPTSKDGK